jgi:hypothetical protein
MNKKYLYVVIYESGEEDLTCEPIRIYRTKKRALKYAKKKVLKTVREGEKLFLRKISKGDDTWEYSMCNECGEVDQHYYYSVKKVRFKE